MLLQDTDVSKLLRTKIGTYIMLATIAVSVVTFILSIRGIPSPFFFGLWLWISGVSFFTFCILIIFRFETISQKIFNISLVVLNIYSWWVFFPIFHEGNSKNYDELTALIFFVAIQIFTIPRIFKLITTYTKY